MNCTAIYHNEGKISERPIELTGLTVEDAIQNKILWLVIVGDLREKAAEILKAMGVSDDITTYLIRPGLSTRLRLFQTNTGIVDIMVQRNSFVTIIYMKAIAIVVAPQSFNFLENAMKEWTAQAESKSLDSVEMSYGFFNYLIDINTENVNQLNTKINEHAKKIIGTPFRGSISEIELLKQDVVTLLEVFESQYTSFGLLPVHFTGQKERMAMLDKIVLGIEHLQRVMERADDKLDIIYHKYLYDMQEKANSKIKTLTIIQSIFVPITFIAGLYGMNFAHMPELGWETGYFFALSLMSIIVILELIIFYRNGWFK